MLYYKQKDCFMCVLREILRDSNLSYKGKDEMGNKERCFIVFIKEEKPFRFIHESEVFI